jgi:glycerophosphoryl diester phosphodiesterase
VIFSDGRRPLVIGHRGAPGLAPENTIPSFEAAIAAGVDIVEIDVGAGLVVAHSEHELPADPLSLDDVLDFLRTSGAGVQIDLKRLGIEGDVADVIRRHGLEERAFVSSTSPRALRRMAGVAPGLPRSISYPNDRYRVSRLAWPRFFTAGTAAVLRAAMPARVPLLLKASRAGVLTLHYALVSEAVVRAARARGALVIAWTVNDPASVERLAALGVDGIATDDPHMAVATLRRP